MDSDSARFLFNNIQKFVNNIKWRWSSVWEDHIMMFDAFLGEAICIVSMIVEPDDHGDPKFLEDRDIIGRSEDAVLNFFKKLRRTYRRVYHKESWRQRICWGRSSWDRRFLLFHSVNTRWGWIFYYRTTWVWGRSRCRADSREAGDKRLSTVHL